MRHRPLIIVVFVAILALCGYLVWSGLSHRGPRTIPEGVQTLTGSLIPAELSLSRRGTHVLKIQDEDIAYVESSSVNLRLYELTEVAVTGTFHLNTDPSDLPLFIVTSLRPIDIPSVEVTLPAVGLTLRVPPAWAVQNFDDGAAFTLTGSIIPLLRVLKSSLTQLPAGAPLFVAGYDAVRVDGPDHSQIVYLLAGRTVVTFTWTPGNDSSLTPAFVQMLRTAVVRSAPSSQGTQTGSTISSSASMSVGSAGSTASGSAAKPCGGPAGVLCPSGYRCSITDTQMGIGTCVPLR